MKKRVGLIGSIVVGAALVTVGVSADFAWAGKQGELNGGGFIGNSHKTDRGTEATEGRATPFPSHHP